MTEASSAGDEALGLDPEQRAAIAAADPALEPFRVVVEAQAQFALLTAGELLDPIEEALPRWGVLAGRLRAAQEADPFARPAVGDFVLARPEPTGSAWRIEQVLPRRSRFVRQAGRRRLEPQLIAANVDRVLVVTSPNADFSPRRLERYLANVHASGACPAIVINKADLACDVAPWVNEARAVALDAPVLAVSAADGTDLDQLEALLGPGRTVALVGSSGVGKSSLINALLGAPKQRIRAARAGDDKGRHTTTHRELLPLPRASDGARRGFLVDTPGMRALALWSDPAALALAFEDVTALAETCRFRDCRHRSEPGCGVRDSGISPSRLASYHRLRDEAEAQAEQARARRPRGRPR